MNTREMIAWYWKNRRAECMEIICESCPEHIGMIEQENYNLNKAENG